MSGVKLIIRSFGLFWRRDEVDWHPGRGRRKSFRLLGRKGAHLPGLRVADFRTQMGIYVLYGNYGPYYVGLTRKKGLGRRLRDHITDIHSEEWDRFSWFGFRATLKTVDGDGLSTLRTLAQVSLGSAENMIADTEALLIKAMGLSNKHDMRFQAAEEWTQVKLFEVEHYCSKVRLR